MASTTAVQREGPWLVRCPGSSRWFPCVGRWTVHGRMSVARRHATAVHRPDPKRRRSCMPCRPPRGSMCRRWWCPCMVPAVAWSMPARAPFPAAFIRAWPWRMRGPAAAPPRSSSMTLRATRVHSIASPSGACDGRRGSTPGVMTAGKHRHGRSCCSMRVDACASTAGRPGLPTASAMHLPRGASSTRLHRTRWRVPRSCGRRRSPAPWRRGRLRMERRSHVPRSTTCRSRRCGSPSRRSPGCARWASAPLGSFGPSVATRW